MTDPRGNIVLDASVGVKLFKDEPGSAEARELLIAHAESAVFVWVPAIFLHEVVAVAVRQRSAAVALDVYAALRDAGIGVVPLDDDIAREALQLTESLGCTFYDALAPAVATLLEAPLYSADRRAHSAFPGVRFLGEQAP